MKKYITKKNDEEIEEEIRKGKKSKNINEMNNAYMTKLNFRETRMIFLMKTNMIETKVNFKNQSQENNICDTCEKQEETTQHLLECEGYKDIRKDIIVKKTPIETIKENDMSKLSQVMYKILEKRKWIKEEKKNAPPKGKERKTNTAPLQTECSPLDEGW